MELQGSAYLYTVATIAMTYVAFTMIFIFLRQARGGSLTKFELFAARNFIKMSFIVVTGSLLPPLLSLFTLPEPLIWRLSSVALALMVIEHAVTFPKRRRAITGVRMPSGMVVAMAAFWLAAVTLGINAIGGPISPISPGPGLFALGVTLPLMVAMWAILRRIETLVDDPEAEDWDPSKG